MKEIFFWNCYYSFLSKPYQEINFKSHLNSVPQAKIGKVLSELHISCLIHFTLLVCAQFYNEIERCLL